MAGPERPGALVDAAPAPARRGGRLTRPAKGAARFALAYLAFEIAYVGVCAALVFARVPGVYRRMILDAVFFFSAISALTAWLPLSLALYLVKKTRVSPMASSLLGGVVAGSASALLLAIYFAWLNTMSFDTSPPADESFSWMVVAVQFLDSLKSSAPSGASGGLVFWAAYFWLPMRIGAGSVPLQDA